MHAATLMRTWCSPGCGISRLPSSTGLPTSLTKTAFCWVAILLSLLYKLCSISRQVVSPSSHLNARPVEILIQRPQRCSNAALHHYLPSRIRSSSQISSSQAAKTWRLFSWRGWAILCLQCRRRSSRIAITDRRRSGNRVTWLSLCQCFDRVDASLSAETRI